MNKAVSGRWCMDSKLMLGELLGLTLDFSRTIFFSSKPAKFYVFFFFFCFVFFKKVRLFT